MIRCDSLKNLNRVITYKNRKDSMRWGGTVLGSLKSKLQELRNSENVGAFRREDRHSKEKKQARS